MKLGALAAVGVFVLTACGSNSTRVIVALSLAMMSLEVPFGTQSPYQSDA